MTAKTNSWASLWRLLEIDDRDVRVLQSLTAFREYPGAPVVVLFTVFVLIVMALEPWLLLAFFVVFGLAMFTRPGRNAYVRLMDFAETHGRPHLAEHFRQMDWAKVAREIYLRDPGMADEHRQFLMSAAAKPRAVRPATASVLVAAVYRRMLNEQADGEWKELVVESPNSR